MTAGGTGERREPVASPSPGPGGPPLRIVLEFDPGDPPSGRLVRDGAAPDEFAGRLELYAALDRARGTRPDHRPTTEKGP
ncbi:MAG: hypothetical protein JST08_18765 [Actinobacteria bacterium]|nr:hypothetical protein [Actinomycetota bacterium]